MVASGLLWLIAAAVLPPPGSGAGLLLAVLGAASHWQDGGGTDYDNLVSLCPHHHDKYHAGAFTIETSSNPLAPFPFLTRHGFPIHASPPEPDSGGDPPPRATAYQPPLGERLALNGVTVSRRRA